MPQLNNQEIRRILPHRPPFLFVDEVLDYQPGAWARAVKHVDPNEAFFAGHFPDYPVMPGVLILEALAQTGALALLSQPGKAGRIAFFGGVKSARFKRQVRPGDILQLECQLTKQRGPVGFGEATAKVDEELVCRAELSFVLPEKEE